jgi:hypothetical protein
VHIAHRLDSGVRNRRLDSMVLTSPDVRRCFGFYQPPARMLYSLIHNNSPGAEEEQASPAAEPQSAEAFTPASQLPRRLTMGDRRNSTHTVGGVGLIGRFDGAAGSTAAAVGDKDGDQEERQGQQEDNAFEPVSVGGSCSVCCCCCRCCCSFWNPPPLMMMSSVP